MGIQNDERNSLAFVNTKIWKIWMKEKLKELQPALQYIEHNGQNNFAFFFLKETFF